MILWFFLVKIVLISSSVITDLDRSVSLGGYSLTTLTLPFQSIGYGLLESRGRLMYCDISHVVVSTLLTVSCFLLGWWLSLNIRCSFVGFHKYLNQMFWQISQLTVLNWTDGIFMSSQWTTRHSISLSKSVWLFRARQSAYSSFCEYRIGRDLVAVDFDGCWLGTHWIGRVLCWLLTDATFRQMIQ